MKRSLFHGIVLASATYMATPLHAANSIPVDAGLPAFQPTPVTVDVHARYLADDGAIRIGGAEHVRYIVERFNAALVKSHPDWRFRDESKGTTSAVPLLTYGVTLFGAMGREINPLETQAFTKAVGAPPLEIRIAHAANDTSQHLATSLAAYVNRANPLAQISAEQVARAVSIGNPDGDLSTWGQLGLAGTWRERRIHPYGTPEFTGFGTYMQANHLGGRPLVPGYEAYNNTEAILHRLAADPAGLAVAAIGLENADIKQLPITGADGAATTTGTPAQVTADRYPYGRYLYLYLRREPGKPLDPVVREYLRFVLSRQGQQIIASQPNGYFPLTAEQAQAERAKLDEVAP
ncbi:PstS family phosphate ABC transporter substrate-binding protein [Pseudomonas typographi]|uniref:PstS family phosphate ABC transporter substrate-binding protein n=1 Tax=Pseudomonas typographi TaxID=2715964 RepID=UPI00168470F0|nr:substrate-binding domain-containing protein [Pseudomonas typographi]MBD1553249.1 phosphate-binding protein [Pseudomonas typographi]MBD1589946.1 phosphate-binding protein [Pseudomonas typographi]